jgi:hypothetical protein
MHCHQQPEPCPLPEITFGGVSALNVVVLSPAMFRVTTPPHAPGAVEVRVKSGERENRSHAFRYYAQDEPPLSSLFERVLIPVYYNGDGAHGSIWRTELALRNSNRYPVQFWNPVVGLPSIAPLSSHDFTLPAAAGGTFLYVPRESASGIHFHSLVRDVSREMEGWGTEVPVVRERDFAEDSLELLNVPLDRRYRRMLRIYSTRSLPAFVGLDVYAMETGAGLGQRYVPLLRETPCSAAGCDQPAFAVVDLDALMPDLPEEGRAGITITASGPLWAFLTITNNETQQVTVISPH